MPTSRFERSPLGAFYRSPLGVRGRDKWEYRFFIVRYQGWGQSDEITSVRTLYSDLNEVFREEYTAEEYPKEPTQHYDPRYLQKLGDPLSTAGKRVRNLVFYVGGRNPTPTGSGIKENYFKTYAFDDGGPLIQSGGPATYVSTYDTVTVSYVRELNTFYWRDEKVTNYDPELEDVVEDYLADDLSVFDTESSSEFFRNETYFFFDPYDELPDEESRSYETDFEHPAGTLSETGTTIGGATYPINHAWPSWSSQAQYAGGDVPFYDDGILRKHLRVSGPLLSAKVVGQNLNITRHPDDEVIQVIRSEGADRTLDTSDSTETLLQEFVSKYGSNRSWFYGGRVDSQSLSVNQIITKINELSGE